ncbi:hypothetical protein [Streptomyces sp. TLI_105]|uniref:hypothetical protein n=1 Tax=Streptomyces sp. TLI_105 TaxID=1881019 RepID=UPI0008983BC6|nr:hypothetical protein [Streptomyces sp. TLI_105]SEE16071.1 Mce-associated membrane protein [Streptomyces sp. TLI_105]
MTRLLRTARRENTGADEAPEADAKSATDEDAQTPTAEEAEAATDPDATESSDGPAKAGTDPDAAAGTDEDAAAATDPDATPAPGASRGRRPAGAWRKAAPAAAVTVLLLGGAGFHYAAHQLRSAPSARNHALTDTETTTRVGGDVAEGLARVFSYTPADTDAAERSSHTVLAGRAARQYSDLLAQVRTNLVEQRITLSTQAVRTGVIELDGDSARLLVFLDQTSRRGKAAATTAAAQLTVTAKHQGDRWLIVDIKAR